MLRQCRHCPFTCIVIYFNLWLALETHNWNVNYEICVSRFDDKWYFDIDVRSAVDPFSFPRRLSLITRPSNNQHNINWHVPYYYDITMYITQYKIIVHGNKYITINEYLHLGYAICNADIYFSVLISFLAKDYFFINSNQIFCENIMLQLFVYQ